MADPAPLDGTAAAAAARLSLAGAFRVRSNLLWQTVLSPEGVRGGHRRPA